MHAFLKISALLIGIFLILVGLALILQQPLDLIFLKEIFIVRKSELQKVGLYGIFVFGVGLALLLTQFFAERYTATIAGIAFVGTLAALYIFMLIARYTVFEVKVETGELEPHDLELAILCPEPTNQTQGAVNRVPIVAFTGAADKIAGLKSTMVDYYERAAVNLDPTFSNILVSQTEHSQRFAHISSALLVLPTHHEAGQIEFILPSVIPVQTDLNLYYSDDQGSRALGSENVQEAFQAQKIMKLNVDRSSDGQSDRPRIRAEISFAGVRDVCGRD